MNDLCKNEILNKAKTLRNKEMKRNGAVKIYIYEND